MAETLHRDDRGPGVKDLQIGANKTFKEREFPWRVIETDGIFGDDTERAAHFAGWLTGLSKDELAEIEKGTIVAEVCALLTGESKPSDDMKKREEERRPTAKKLQFLHEKREKMPDKDGIVTIDGHPVAAWIAKWVEKSRAAGWRGTVQSGYRTPEYSEGLCMHICGQPSCPGRCAGRSSNHSGLIEPAGAVDVTLTDSFAAIQRQIGSPLRNDLPNDPVHFSSTGH